MYHPLYEIIWHENIEFCNNLLWRVNTSNNKRLLGGSPGLVVMGGDSRPKGRGFESRRRILDGHDIFHIDLL